MTMSGQPQRRWWLSRIGLLGLLILVATRSVGSAPLGKSEIPPITNRISFKVSLAPEDIFSDRNAVGKTLTDVYPGEVLTLTILGTPIPPYNTYPLTMYAKGQTPEALSQLLYDDNPDLTPLWPVIESEAEFVNIESVGIWLEHLKPFTWVQQILVNPKAKPGKTTLHFRIHAQGCSEKGGCVWGDQDFNVEVTIAEPKTPLPAVSIDPARFKSTLPREIEITAAIRDQAAKREKERKKGQEEAKAPSGTDTGSTEATVPGANDGLLAFLLTAVGFGAISLLTPCVFPIIPITVSFFLKQSERKDPSGLSEAMTPAPHQHSALLLALVYSGTIVTVLTVCGMLLIPVIAPFSAHWITNLILGTLFVVFALSLFGMFEIALPNWLLNLTSSQEGKGGFVGTMFMALTFTIISFTCVAPFYGGFIALASSATTVTAWFKLFLGALVYSLTFASPFFLLALFPSFLRTLPKSGAWMNTLKVVMGFLELAAALKFFRSAELYLSGSTSFFTYDLVLSLYVVLAVLCGLYLLNLFHLPHDHGKPETLGVLQLLFAIAFISLGLYLTPALFAKDPEELRQRGKVFSWVDSFLLPERHASSGTGKGAKAASEVDLNWIGNLDRGLEEARKQKRRVFIDFTGITCTNCRINENTVFVRPEIRELLNKYVLVQLYTDKVPPYYEPTTSGAENQALQDSRFKTLQLPYYVIVEPTADGFEIVKGYPQEGVINKVEQFAAFLRDNVGGK
jgi:thiol:disulfide interchange protein